jgi:hypothetical protein
MTASERIMERAIVFICASFLSVIFGEPPGPSPGGIQFFDWGEFAALKSP